MADPTIRDLYLAAGGDPDLTDPTISQLYQSIVALSAGAGGINWRGAWLIGTDYAQGDGVRHGGLAYLALAANTGSEPPSANWQLVIVEGPQGIQGIQGIQGAAGSGGLPALAIVRTGGVAPFPPIVVSGYQVDGVISGSLVAAVFELPADATDLAFPNLGFIPASIGFAGGIS